MPSVIQAMQEKLSGVTEALTTDISIGDIPQLKGHEVVSENSYVTKNYSYTTEVVRQPQEVILEMDGTKVARTLIAPLNTEVNRLGVSLS